MTDLDEVHGTALAAQLMVFSLIGALKSKRIFSKSEVVALFESTLSAVERYPHADPAAMAARKALEGMAAQAAAAPQ